MRKTLHLIASSDISTPTGAFYRSFENFNLYEPPTPVAQSIVGHEDVFQAYYDWVSTLEFDGVDEAIAEAKEHLELLGEWLNSKMNSGAIVNWDLY